MAGYLIVDIKQIHDEQRYADYRARVPASLAAAGGRYLVRGGATEVLEGDYQPGRIVVVRFDSARIARDWWASKEYAALRDLRQQASSGNMIVVEGVPDSPGT